jgi:hypothetical protein
LKGDLPVSDLDKAYETQIRNIQAKTGRSLDELGAIVRQSGLTKHSEIRAMLQRDLGLGYGDANSLVHFVLKSDGGRAAKAKGATTADVLAEIYSGGKAALRPIHEALMAAIDQFGEFEIAPKKGYVSLRRKKQFAMLGPGSQTRVDLGLNMKGVPATERLQARPPGEMCQYTVKLARVDEVDAELIDWVKQAYESAG